MILCVLCLGPVRISGNAGIVGAMNQIVVLQVLLSSSHFRKDEWNISIRRNFSCDCIARPRVKVSWFCTPCLAVTPHPSTCP